LLESRVESPKEAKLSRNDGITPLIMAAAMNHDLCVGVLLASGLDPNEESKVNSIQAARICHFTDFYF
jgi:ankyrin repeat protein